MVIREIYINNFSLRHHEALNFVKLFNHLMLATVKKSVDERHQGTYPAPTNGSAKYKVQTVISWTL